MRLRHAPREASRFVRRALGFGPAPPEELLRLISELKPGDTFVDIGANVGLFTSYAARAVGPSGRVLAIEPNPALQEQLRASVAGMSNVQFAPVAVGDAPGSATLHVFNQHTRSSLLEHARKNRYTSDDRNRADPVVVPVQPLLSILTAHGIEQVDALKIGIEGYEDRALIPFFESAPEHLWPRHVLIECSPHVWKEDCIGYMQARDYIPTWKERSDMLLTRGVIRPDVAAGSNEPRH